VDIVVKGRNVEVPDHYREHVADKLSKVERYDQKLIRSDVELFHERNPRQSDKCQRVEITVMTRGPVVRAEACAKDFYSALDCAINKLDARLRRAADRRRLGGRRNRRPAHRPTRLRAAGQGGHHRRGPRGT
jgi:ribosomal subunit interface protein